MLIKKAIIKNFKLLRDVSLFFSVDRSQPLTVIRGENGSGKTSILHALRWGLFGDDGLRDASGANTPSLSAKHLPAGKEVEISVEVHLQDESGEGYQLTRRLVETRPSGNEPVLRTSERVDLVKLDRKAGAVQVADPQGFINRHLPSRLKDVYFTDGDSVQTFISKRSEGRKRVGEAIRQLMGLVDMGNLEELLRKSRGAVRKKIGESGGDRLKRLSEREEVLSRSIEEQERQLEGLESRKQKLSEVVERAQERRASMSGVNDLPELNARLESAQRDGHRAREEQFAKHRDLREHLASQSFACALIPDLFASAYDHLEVLHQNGKVPGYQTPLLRHCLKQERCICGAQLPEGGDARIQVEQMVDMAEKGDANKERVDALHLWVSSAKRQLEVEEVDAIDRLDMLDRAIANQRNAERRAESIAEATEEKIRQIDHEEVKALSRQIQEADEDKEKVNQEIGAIKSRLKAEKEDQSQLVSEVQKLTDAEGIADNLRKTERLIEYGLEVIGAAKERLEGEEVDRVSKDMEQMFLEIVGADRKQAGNVFDSVSITKEKEIQVTTANGQVLRDAFDINGASLRALTMSFIWALTRVAGRVAPRIIDTPIGMTSGAVRKKLVDRITQPPADDEPQFQVALLMTRDELTGVRELIAERAGKVQTITCSKDFPRDLVNDPEVDEPCVYVCSCGPGVFCSKCERAADSMSGRVTVE